MNSYSIEVHGTLRIRWDIEAKDLDSALAAAAVRADDMLRDDGELFKVTAAFVGRIPADLPD